MAALHGQVPCTGAISSSGNQILLLFGEGTATTSIQKKARSILVQHGEQVLVPKGTVMRVMKVITFVIRLIIYNKIVYQLKKNKTNRWDCFKKLIAPFIRGKGRATLEQQVIIYTKMIYIPFPIFTLYYKNNISIHSFRAKFHNTFSFV